MDAGLHKETLSAARAQAAALCSVLQDADVPVTAGLLEVHVHAVRAADFKLQRPFHSQCHQAHISGVLLAACVQMCRNAAAHSQDRLLQGRLEEWLLRGVGVQAAGLLPSVRCGLEAALLSALAAAAGGAPLAALLSPAEPAVHESAAVLNTSDAAGSIQVCGLVDSFPSAEATAAAAVQLVRQGHTNLKLKVIDRAQPPSTSTCSPTYQDAGSMQYSSITQPSYIGRWTLAFRSLVEQVGRHS